MINFKSFILFTVILFAGASAFAQEHQHNEHLSTLLEHYMNAKDALAEDDFDEAHSSLTELRKEVVESDEMNHHEEHSQIHTEHHDSMVEAVNNAAQAGDIGELRSSFKDISSNLIKALENKGFDEESLYLQYCPMADNNEGARWINDKKEVVNPYMGEKMIGCGETEKEIESR